MRAVDEGEGEATAGLGIPSDPRPLRIGSRTFTWGERTYVMGIINVTPDSFSGDGLLAGPVAAVAPRRRGRGPTLAPIPVERIVLQARSMTAEGADILDIGGESSRPGHVPIDAAEEARRVVPAVTAVRAALPDMPISVDTSKAAVAAAAFDAGADLVNNVQGVFGDRALLAVVAERGVPIVLMHNRLEPRYSNLLAEVIGDLQRAIDGALSAGVGWEDIIVDPGFGFGKAPVHNLALLAGLAGLRVLGRPILLGTSRKSTLGRVLDLPPEERLEATLATTALGIASGVDIVRVHDVRPNVRVARMADAIVRGSAATPHEPAQPAGR